MIGKTFLAILFLVGAVVGSISDPSSYPFENPNTAFGTNTGSESDNPASAHGDSETGHTREPDRTYETKHGRSVKVFDRALNPHQVASLRHLTMPHMSRSFLNSTWQFLHRDAATGGEEGSSSAGNVPWMLRIDASWYSRTRLGRSMAKLLSGSWQRERLLPYDVRIVALRRGDDTIVNEAISDDLNEVCSIAFLNSQQWKGDYYGESIFYDEDEEILAACQPKPARVVAWDSSLEYLMRPTSMTYATSQYLLMVRWTGNATLAAVAEEARRDYEEGTQRGIAEGIFTGEEHTVPEDLDVRQYETQHIVTRSQKKNVHVFDNLLTRSDVDALRMYAKRYGSFVFKDYTVGDEGSDNVQWMGKYDIPLFVRSKFWRIFQKVVKYTSGSHGDWYPYDVACNIVRSADHTRIHSDVRNDKDTEWTLLVYLSPEWDAGSYGETAWFTGSEGDDMTNDVDIETEVQPLYGRISIFEGLIPHAARPPSATYHGPRYSFAVKMASSPWLSGRNLMQEDFHERLDVLSNFKSLGKKYTQIMKLEDADGTSHSRLLQRYWRHFLDGNEHGREAILEEMFEATKNNGTELLTLLKHCTDVMTSKLRQLGIEKGKQI